MPFFLYYFSVANCPLSTIEEASPRSSPDSIYSYSHILCSTSHTTHLLLSVFFIFQTQLHPTKIKMSTTCSPKRRLTCAFLIFLCTTINYNNGTCQAAPNITTPPSTPSSTSTSHSIIRSIGFTGCSSTSSTEQIQLSNLALLYDGQSNTISLKADGSTDKELDASSGKPMEPLSCCRISHSESSHP